LRAAAPPFIKTKEKLAKVLESTQRKEKITALILFVFSLIYLYGCWRLKLGTMDNPGPGFIPTLVGFLLFLFTAAYLYRVFKGKRPEKGIAEKAAVQEPNYRVVVGILGSILIYPFLLGVLNFIIATLITMFLMLILLKYKNLAFSFFVALIITVVSFVVFARFLGVVLPSGILEELFYRIGR
jgi:putative tricarboxylic transport membrane protein